MPRFLIEVPHEDEKVACARAVQVLLSTGSHFMTNADFGCIDGDHKDGSLSRWTIGTRPGQFCRRCTDLRPKIVQLNRFSMEELDTIIRGHQ